MTQRQQHLPNPESNTVKEDYFKCPVTIPFLDHLSDLSSRFDLHTKRAASLQGLLPTRITPDSSVQDIQEAATFYADDLPNASIIDGVSPLEVQVAFCFSEGETTDAK